MSLHLCNGDPIVDVLTDTFNANIVRVPEERLQPLWVIGQRKKERSARGLLSELLTSSLSSPTIVESAMASVSGRKTKSVDLKIGLEILGGFLAGMGVGQAAPGIATKLSGVREVSFAFGDVQRRYVDVGSLGKALAGKKLDLANPAAAIFTGEQSWKCFIVDSIVTSASFTIHADKTASQSFQLALPEVQQLIAANAGVAAKQSSQLDITFTGVARLAFAFTALRAELAPDGEILRLPSAQKNLFLAAGEHHDRLGDDREMLELSRFE